MQFLIGVNDVYQPVRSNLLARDPLPDVKDPFSIVFREDSHRGLAYGKLSTKSLVASVVRTNNCNNNFNKSVNTNDNNNRGPNHNLVCKHCGFIGHTIERCYELNGHHAGFKRNPNLSTQSGFVKKFSGNNVDVSQNASTSTIDISSHRLTIGHLIGTMAKTTAISSLQLNKNMVLFDLLVVPEYNVSLLSVNKMIKDCGDWRGHLSDQVLYVLSHKGGFKSVNHVTSKDGYKYFLTVVDDFSKAVWVYLLKTKVDVYDCIKGFLNLIYTQFGINVKMVRSDNGTEFVNNKLSDLFTSVGIIHQNSCSYTPQRNGIMERSHRHLLNVSRSLMFQEGFLYVCGLNVY
ncbi:ribonuclease H-like domain-containing protein [Tanacetum coccineum]